MIFNENVFIDNKYYKWYEKLINKRLSIPYSGEGEKHHYIPKSIIKNNDLVFLSYREHYIAHLLLVKCVKDAYKIKMLLALTAMKLKVTRVASFNSRLFEILKNNANKARSDKMKNKPRSNATIEKLRAANLGKKASKKTKYLMSIKQKERFANMTKEEMEVFRQKRSGENNGRAKKANIYNIKGELLASDVVISVWASENGYNNSSLCKTAKFDQSKPKSSSNMFSVRGIYARYI